MIMLNDTFFDLVIPVIIFHVFMVKVGLWFTCGVPQFMDLLTQTCQVKQIKEN